MKIKIKQGRDRKFTAQLVGENNEIVFSTSRQGYNRRNDAQAAVLLVREWFSFRGRQSVIDSIIDEKPVVKKSGKRKAKGGPARRVLEDWEKE